MLSFHYFFCFCAARIFLPVKIKNKIANFCTLPCQKPIDWAPDRAGSVTLPKQTNIPNARDRFGEHVIL